MEPTTLRSRADNPGVTSPWPWFYWIWATQLLSAIGGPFQSIAVALWVLDTGQGPTTLAGVLAIGTASQVVGALLGGPLVDRFGPIRVMLGCDSSRTILSFVLAVLVGHGGALTPIVTLLAINGATAGAFRPALRSVPAFTLDEPDRTRGNSYLSVSDNVSMLAGALIGGIIVAAVGPGVAITVNAAGFFIGALGAMVVLYKSPTYEHEGKVESQADLRPAGIMSGLKYCIQTPWLLSLIAIDAVMDVATAGQLSIGLPVIARGFGGGASLGIMLAALAGGSIVGAIAAPRFNDVDIGRPRLIAVLHLLQAPFLAAVAITGSPLTSGVCLLVMGALNGVAVVIYVSLLQQYIPRPMLGRALAVLTVAGLSLQPVGQLLSGLFIGAGYLSQSFFVAAIAMAVVSLIYMWLPAMRKVV